MRKALLWFMVIGLGLKLGATLEHLIENPKYQRLTDNGIFINSAAPAVRELPPTGQDFTP